MSLTEKSSSHFGGVGECYPSDLHILQHANLKQSNFVKISFLLTILDMGRVVQQKTFARV